jgi:serine/threonine protein kinase
VARGPDGHPRIRYFGDYELLEEIARGGMGVVYKARQVSLNRTVAVKMILAGQLASPAEVQRFYTEAEAAAQLDHPNIVAIHEVGQHDGQHYFSMDYVDGKNLSQVVAGKPLPSIKAAAYVKAMAEAVHHAHLRGVLHRDLKPSNVLIDGSDQPRITDFGLARQMHDRAGITKTGVALGTPSYMPPEQAAGKRGEMGPASDVYSLGAILYELLTGRPPFKAASPMDTILQVLEQEPVSPRKLNPLTPPDLETICQKCLEKSPLKRYHSARELAEELGRFLNHEPILARRASRIRRMWNWGRRRPWILTGMASLLVLVPFPAGKFRAAS